MERIRDHLKQGREVETFPATSKLVTVEEEPTAMTNASHIAATYFARVSSEYPASHDAQGAKIALLCRENQDYSPEELMTELLADSEKIENLIQAANTFHSTRNNGPKYISGKIFPIDEELAKDVIKENFRRAQKLLVLDSSELKHILELYHSYKEMDDRDRAFINFKHEVDTLIEAKTKNN